MDSHSHFHYILGYLIVLTSHNWPVLVSLGLALHAAWRLYRQPSRSHVAWLYGWSLLVFAYEYNKHLGEELARPVMFLFTTDWAWVVPIGVFLVTVLPVPLILLAAVVFLLRALGRPPLSFGAVGESTGEV